MAPNGTAGSETTTEQLQKDGNDCRGMLSAKNIMKVWLYPTQPEGWVPKALMVVHRLGWELGTRDDHDLRIYFSKWTIDRDGLQWGREERIRGGKGTVVLPKSINGGCTDVSKSRVDRVLVRTFGYSSLVDPMTTACLEKTELQSWKAFRRVPKGTERKPDVVYQELVDTTVGGVYVDLRPVMMDGDVVSVVVKRKPRQFNSPGSQMFFTEPANVFTSDEISKLGDYSREFGLDFGEMDCVRDNKTGRLYVIDVNPTAHTEPNLLYIEEQLGKLARELTEKRYAALFRERFDTDRWRVR